ncbi:hypothetical protein PMI34_02756 [Pseudomonas sp. GM74]|nr:hypothetical protein PMI34_02756 [Pseudomonas sp. GM74]
MHKTIKIRRIDSRTIKTRRREAQLTDSFGEALYLGLAPRPGREQQKTVLRQSLYWLDRKITAIQRPKQSVCSWLPIGRVMKESFMARALNKNKKPETKNKNRACNYFLGSFGSPCGFRRLVCSSCRAARGCVRRRSRRKSRQLVPSDTPQTQVSRRLRRRTPPRAARQLLQAAIYVVK